MGGKQLPSVMLFLSWLKPCKSLYRRLTTCCWFVLVCGHCEDKRQPADH
jgi:hypothetical protein